MEFFATNGKRPVRLDEATRQFAYESLHHKYGKEAWETPGVVMDGYDGFDQLTDLQKYDAAIECIARTATIRICPHEKISGAANLGYAIHHWVPASFKGEPFLSSISHFTADFETVLRKGISYIERQAQEALAVHSGTEREPFARSCVHCLQCLRIWHGRYLEALEKSPAHQANYHNLCRVPFEPPQTFHEAVQSLWFTFAFLRLCGNWPGIGRIDWLLGPYLEKDLAEGRLTLEEARTILAHFFIKGCEWITGGLYAGGDAQHYQNILLAGVDENGQEVTNPVTYLVLDVLEELGISDFPTSVRVNRHTDPHLLHRVAEVIRLGGGVLAVYNEEVVIDSLVQYGYSLSEARKFANDGCWEVQVPGKTEFHYLAFDALQILQGKTLARISTETEYEDFEALYQAYVRDLTDSLEGFMAERNTYHFEDTQLPIDQWRWRPCIPCTVVSLFEQGCIEKGLAYHQGGPVYYTLSPHIGGLPDVVNSLYAMKKLVYDDQVVTLVALMDILKNNWEGHEPLRQRALNRYIYYGNDNDEVDIIARDIIGAFSDICDSLNQRNLYRTPAGISTFGRQLGWAPYRGATPYGKKANAVLSGNCSPTPGTDREGATAIIKSYCKADFRRVACGAALDIKLLPSAVNGENGTEAIASLIRGFVTLGGHFMQLDIADAQLLKEAQEHPEEHQTLSVRISGWNARFVTLDKEFQDMIIAQTGSGF